MNQNIVIIFITNNLTSTEVLESCDGTIVIREVRESENHGVRELGSQGVRESGSQGVRESGSQINQRGHQSTPKSP